MRLKVCTVLALAAALFLSACSKGDADLQKAAADKLAADKVVGVTVVVKDANATLTGEVADNALRTKAEASVKSIEGIKTVKNSLTLTPPPARVGPLPDNEIEGEVNARFRKAGIEGVTVSVKDGVVTVSGKVDKDQMARVMLIAGEGNPNPINKLTVK